MTDTALYRAQRLVQALEGEAFYDRTPALTDALVLARRTLAQLEVSRRW